jgi:hypothetical protein
MWAKLNRGITYKSEMQRKCCRELMPVTKIKLSAI